MTPACQKTAKAPARVGAAALLTLALASQPLALRAQPDAPWFAIPWFAPPPPATPAPNEPKALAKPKAHKEARPAPKDKKPAAKEVKKTDPAAEPAPEAPPPPYEPQLLRLAEILGALAYLDDLCGSSEGWRGRMQEVLEAEARTQDRKERLAGAFNKSFHDYENVYRACSPNAKIVIGRFLNEGGRIAREVASRFSAT